MFLTEKWRKDQYKNLIKKIQQTHNEYITIAVKKKEKLLCNIFAELTFMRGKNL